MNNHCNKPANISGSKIVFPCCGNNGNNSSNGLGLDEVGVMLFLRNNPGLFPPKLQNDSPSYYIEVHIPIFDDAYEGLEPLGTTVKEYLAKYGFAEVVRNSTSRKNGPKKTAAEDRRNYALKVVHPGEMCSAPSEMVCDLSKATAYVVLKNSKGGYDDAALCIARIAYDDSERTLSVWVHGEKPTEQS